MRRRLLSGALLCRAACGEMAVVSPRVLTGAGASSRRCSSQKTAPPPPWERSFPALFVRGGTSNGLVIREDALPAYSAEGSTAARLAARAAAWTPVLAPAMGAPDRLYGRQLDGMGSGVSSTSKVCVIAQAGGDSHDVPAGGQPADVAFTFVQVGIRDGQLDLAGNCGNMISAVGPLAFDLGWGGTVEADGPDGPTAAVRIFNTNTCKTVVSRFRVAGTPPRFCADGDYAIDGVAGTHSRITLSFLRPAGARTGVASGLPTGQPVDLLPLPSPGPSIPASLIDVSNPGVFVLAASLGLADSSAPDELGRAAAAIEADAGLQATLEHLRRAGAERMGLDPDAQSVPKIVLLFPGHRRQDIRCVALSMGQVHKATPLTLALCLGASANMPGTLAEQLVRAGRRKQPQQQPGGLGNKNSEHTSTISIGHPSGSVDVGTTLDPDGTVASAELHRTARVLMKGRVFY